MIVLNVIIVIVKFNVLKPGLVVDPVKALGHWSDRMTIDPVYIKIFMT